MSAETALSPASPPPTTRMSDRVPVCGDRPHTPVLKKLKLGLRLQPRLRCLPLS